MLTRDSSRFLTPYIVLKFKIRNTLRVTRYIENSEIYLSQPNLIMEFRAKNNNYANKKIQFFDSSSLSCSKSFEFLGFCDEFFFRWKVNILASWWNFFLETFPIPFKRSSKFRSWARPLASLSRADRKSWLNLWIYELKWGKFMLKFLSSLTSVQQETLHFVALQQTHRRTHHCSVLSSAARSQGSGEATRVSIFVFSRHGLDSGLAFSALYQ
jgi:hypothetical protein